MNNLIYRGYKSISRAIQNGVFDPNPIRRAQGAPFVHPTFPTGLDDDYPRIAIKLENFTPKAIGAGNVVAYEPTCRQHGIYGSMSFKVFIFIKKETEYPIEIDGAAFKAKNEFLAQYMVKEVYMALLDYILTEQVRSDGFWVISPSQLIVTPSSLEVDTHRIVNEVSLTIWGIEGSEPQLFDTEELIETINHLMTVEVIDP